MTIEMRFSRQLTEAQSRLLLANGDRLARLHPQEKKRLKPACLLYLPGRHAQWYLAAFTYEMPMSFWGLADVGGAHPLYQEIVLEDLPREVRFDAGFQPGKTLEDYRREAIAYRVESCGFNRKERLG